MKCPYCQEEMVYGRVLGDRYRLKWMPDDKKLLLGIWAQDSIPIGEDSGGFGRPVLKSYICKKCNKLIADIPAGDLR